MDINKICKETSMTTIFAVLFFVLGMCFIVDQKIGICVAIVFLFLFGSIYYGRRDIKEGYEPKKMLGSNIHTHTPGSGYQTSETDMNNEGKTIYSKRVPFPDGTLPIPMPGKDCKNYKKTMPYKMTDPDLGNGNMSYVTKYDLLNKTSIWREDAPSKRYVQESNLSCPKGISDNCIRFFNDPTKITPQTIDNEYFSKNNALQGGQNPKTLIPPMVTRPCYSMDWRDNTVLVPNVINGSNNENLYKSGYLSSEELEPENVVENYSYTEQEPKHVSYDKKTWSDAVNMVNGYDKMPSQFPSNQPQGNCGKDKEFSEYNRRLFTQTVQPGVYYKNDVAETINSNLGISFQQEFLPRTFSDVQNGMLIEDHDPADAPEPPRIMKIQEPDAFNTYDPRFSGYGTSYRNYLDPVTGQTRYPYDDINSIRMPNYIVRSKIDTHNYADKYGPMQSAGLSLNQIRKLAQNSFLDDTTSHRNDITSKLMRKTNSEMWQRRIAPITKSSRMLGSSSASA